MCDFLTLATRPHHATTRRSRPYCYHHPPPSRATRNIRDTDGGGGARDKWSTRGEHGHSAAKQPAAFLLWLLAPVSNSGLGLPCRCLQPAANGRTETTRYDVSSGQNVCAQVMVRFAVVVG